MPGTRKLGRSTDQRRAMLRAMVTFLFENGKIETTVTRAKEVSAMAEKMITLAKVGDLHSKRQIFAYVTKEKLAKNLVRTKSCEMKKGILLLCFALCLGIFYGQVPATSANFKQQQKE